MKLYYQPGVCSLAPHILLREAGLEFTLEKVDGKTKRTASGEDYLQINPHGYVPALQISADLILTEGPAIMQYIADQAPQTTLGTLAPANGTIERYRLQSWLNFITSELHKSYSVLFKPDMPAEGKAVYRAHIGTRLAHLNQVLTEQDTLLASGYSAADVYLFVVLNWSSFVDVDLSPWSALHTFRQRMEARPAVQAAMRAEGLLR